MERTLNTLRYKNVREIVNGLLESVMEFCGDQPVADDICIIGVEVNDRAA
jgi:serine phosphatase RsbU (regulator of sigma subunit)